MSKEFVEKFLEDDKDNNDDLLFSYRGVLYPSRLCKVETFEALEAMEARKDDVLIVAYPKCGTNWSRYILNDVVAEIHRDLTPPNNFQLLEFGHPEKIKDINEWPSPRVFTTHLLYDNIPKSFFEKKVKILVIFRNPKDTAVSYYHFQNKNLLLPSVDSWDEFFQKFMNGEVAWQSYFEHALAWDKHMDDENVMILTYEELKENLCEGIKQIAEFYAFPLSEEKIKSLASKATFQEIRDRASQTHGSIAPVIFRKGEVGDWKTLFTEAQSREMDAKFEECLAGTKLGRRLRYDKYCKF
ncbi:sulfotransferase 6B1-like [Anolis sagrei]|uniref:sulfotransferase 6B1-like n=1 Tax=Anolis sagrei TaxID=38937 RepID=UPI0035214334